MNKENTNKSVAPCNGSKLTNRNPNADVFSIFDDDFGVFHNEFDSFIERVFNRAWSNPLWLSKRNYRVYDVNEKDNEYVIEVELPRYKKEQIKLETVNNTIQLTAQNGKGSYTKTWSLSNADLDKVTSKLEDGVLTIMVPKTVQAQSKVIAIN